MACFEPNDDVCDAKMGNIQVRPRIYRTSSSNGSQKAAAAEEYILLMSDNMGIKVEELKASIRSGSEQYPDEMLFEDYQNLIVSYNAEAAGLSRIGIVGYVAAFRPHLVELLLIEPVKLLFVCGIDTSDIMLEYIKSKLNEEGKILWNDAGPEGRKWLRDHLYKKKLFVETLLSNFKEFTDEI